MILLRFTVTNHKSLRDTAELDLMSSTMTKRLPDDGDWVGATYRVAAVYGANASGKSTVVDALSFARSAIELSASAWLREESLPQVHFRLDDTSHNAPSTYVFEFEHDGCRYEYGFSVLQGAVAEEWLHSYPTTRRRILYTRTEGNGITAGRHLGKSGLPVQVSPRELLLSRAHVVGHSFLAPIATALATQIGVQRLARNESALSVQVEQLKSRLESGEIDAESLGTLLEVADVGIAAVATERRELPENVQSLPRQLAETLVGGGSEQRIGGLVYRDKNSRVELTFVHHGAPAGTTFGLSSESDGTISWLVLATHALTVLHKGGVFVIDEIDTSLHPHLVAVLVGFFASQDINPLGAQLVFTTHDVSLLSPTSSVELQPEQVWMTEKDETGATQLFCLDEFSPRAQHNLGKRYLEGRYGGVPFTSLSLMRNLTNTQDKNVG